MRIHKKLLLILFTPIPAFSFSFGQKAHVYVSGTKAQKQIQGLKRRKTFRDNYLAAVKSLVVVAFIFISFSSTGQSWPGAIRLIHSGSPAITYRFDSAFSSRIIVNNVAFVDSVNNGQLGTIYDSSTWNNLSSFEMNSGASVVANQLIVTEADNSYTNYLRLPSQTCLDDQTFRVDYRITTLNAGDSGLVIGSVSTNAFAVSTLQVYLNTTTKKVLIKYNNSGTINWIVSSGTMPSISQGDSITIIYGNNYGVVTATATNRSTSQTVSVSYTNTFVFGNPVVIANTGKITVNPGKGTYQINRWRYSSAIPINQVLVTIGYSITQGFYAGSVSRGWPRQIGGPVSAGSADYTTSILNRLAEVYSLKPRNVIIGGLAGNDIRFGVATGTWQSNLHAINDSLTAHGINVWYTFETPDNSHDITAANTYIAAQWPGKYVDIYTPLWSGTGTGLNSIFNAGDGLHLSPLAHDSISTLIKQSPVYSKILHGGGSTISGLTANRVTLSASPSTITDDGSLTWDGVNKRLTIGTGTVSYAEDINISHSTTGSAAQSVQNTTTTGNEGIIYVEGANDYANFGRYNTATAGNWAGTSIVNASSTFILNLGGGTVGIKPLVLNGTPVFALPGSTGTNIGFRQDATGLRVGVISGLNTANTQAFEVDGVTIMKGVPSITGTPNILAMGTDSTIRQIAFPNGSTVPGGSNTQVQFNGSGSFAGSSSFSWDNTNNRLTIGTGTVSYPTDINISRSTSSFAGFGMQNTNTAGSEASIYAEGSSDYHNLGRYNSTASGNWGGTTIPVASSTFLLTVGGGTVGNKTILLNGTPVLVIPGTTGTNIGYRQDASGFRIDQIGNLQTTNTAALEVLNGKALFGSGTDNSTGQVQITNTSNALALHYDATHYGTITSGSAGDILIQNHGTGSTGVFITGNLNLSSAGNAIYIAEGTNGRSGEVALISGTKSISITGVATSSRMFVQLRNQSGTTNTTAQYEATCTANSCTINAVTSAGTNTVNTGDTSTVDYFVIN